MDGKGAILIVGAVAMGWAFWKRKQDAAQDAEIIYVRREKSTDGNILAAALGWLVDGLGAAQGAATGGLSFQTPSAPVGGSGGLSGLLGLIGSIEAPAGYDQVYGGSKIATPRPLTQMTVAEVLEWQDRSVAAGSASSAAGRYQVIRSTLRDMVSRGVVSRGERFDAAAQDRIAVALAERRGLSSYRAGQISAETFANNLAKEWASLPRVTGAGAGRSHYDGDGLNSALTTPDQILSAIRGVS